MSEEETIHVADVSQGIGGDATAEPGTPVELPVVELLTGRGFITGKSGSGKSNTASVLIENLLDNNFPVLIVDTDGEYYGLKEEYEILHAGADEECDIVVSPEHAEKIASLALEQNVPIILDVSGYLEESAANELVLEVTKKLFAKEKKLKKPFLMVLEECHEYIPESGGMDETGKMLIKVGKRGRKHGLGIVGISQRPADVKKDYITQCDWLCWHRLTWDNDTKVVGRILGSKYSDAIEEMDDGEAFLMTDWDESIRRIQFHRKQTFDAGATPGLEDFERPELKSVSGNLVSELQEISDEKARHESEMADLRQELDKKRQRITQLEQELEEARDLSNMADQFAQALLGKAEAPYRGGQGRNLRDPKQAGDSGQSDLGEYEDGTDGGSGDDDPAAGAGDDETSAAETSAAGTSTSDASSPAEPETAAESTGEAFTEDVADDPASDVDPVTRADVAEGALRFDDAMELGTREAVIDELKGRIEALPELSQAMLRHYRREGVSEPIAAHIDAGGDGDSGHAYSRHRPIRKSGVIRHAGRGHYKYAVPELIREAYADRLDDDAVREMVREVEQVFVPPAERAYAPDAGPTDVTGESAGDEARESIDASAPREVDEADDGGADDDEAAEVAATGDEADGETAVEASADAGLSDTAREFANVADAVEATADLRNGSDDEAAAETTNAAGPDDADEGDDAVAGDDANDADDEPVVAPDDDAEIIS